MSIVTSELPPRYDTIEKVADTPADVHDGSHSSSKSSRRSSATSNPIMISLVHCEPGKINHRDKICTGKKLETISDIISLPPASTSFMDFSEALVKRAEKRYEIKLMNIPESEPTMSSIAVVMRYGGEGGKHVILTDDEAWKAARAALEKDGMRSNERKVVLELWFAKVPKDYREQKAKKGKKGGHLKCVVM
jgi:hypothetical protein